jgi:GNAT superfamily N-acetyltransferase
MIVWTDVDLYRRGCATLLASWEEYARGSVDAIVHRFPGVVAAAFPHQPERGVYNNALLDRGLGPHERGRALDAMQAAYADVNLDRFAAWVHESDEPMRAELERRGFTVDTTTRAMGMPLERIRVPDPTISLGPAPWSEYLQYERLPPAFLKDADHASFHVLAAREAGTIAAAALAYDQGADCGIYNVGTVEPARRRGFGTAVTLAQLSAAQDRGCQTASLQSTPMAERIYGSLGFRDLGRILEYVPSPRDRASVELV